MPKLTAEKPHSYRKKQPQPRETETHQQLMSESEDAENADTIFSDNLRKIERKIVTTTEVALVTLGSILISGIAYCAYSLYKKHVMPIVESPESIKWQQDAMSPDFVYDDKKIAQIWKDFRDEQLARQVWKRPNINLHAIPRSHLWMYILSYLDSMNPYHNLLVDERLPEQDISMVSPGYHAPGIHTDYATPTDGDYLSRNSAIREEKREVVPNHDASKKTSVKRGKTRKPRAIEHEEMIAINKEISDLITSLASVFPTTQTDFLNAELLAMLQTLATKTRSQDMLVDFFVNVLNDSPKWDGYAQRNEIATEFVLRSLWKSADSIINIEEFNPITDMKNQLLSRKYEQRRKERIQNKELKIAAFYLKKEYPESVEKGVISSDQVMIHIVNKDDLHHSRIFTIASLLNGRHLAFIGNSTEVFIHFDGDHSGLTDPFLEDITKHASVEAFLHFRDLQYGDMNAANLLTLELQRVEPIPLYFDVTETLTALKNAIQAPFEEERKAMDLESRLTVEGLERMRMKHYLIFSDNALIQMTTQREIEKLLATRSAFLKSTALDGDQIATTDIHFSYLDNDKKNQRNAARIAEILMLGTGLGWMDEVISGNADISIHWPGDYEEIVEDLLSLRTNTAVQANQLKIYRKQIKLRTWLAEAMPTHTQRMRDRLDEEAFLFNLHDLNLSDKFSINFERYKMHVTEKHPHPGPYDMTLGEVMSGKIAVLNVGEYHYESFYLSGMPAHIPEHLQKDFEALVYRLAETTSEAENEYLEGINLVSKNKLIEQNFNTYIDTLLYFIPDVEKKHWLCFPEAPALLVLAGFSLTTHIMPSKAAQTRILNNNNTPIHVISITTGARWHFESPQSFLFQIRHDSILRNYIKGHFAFGAEFNTDKLGLMPFEEKDYFKKIIEFQKMESNRRTKNKEEANRDDLLAQFSDLGYLLSIPAAGMPLAAAFIYTTFLFTCPAVLQALNADTDEEAKAFADKVGVNIMGNALETLVSFGVGTAFTIGVKKALAGTIKKMLPAEREMISRVLERKIAIDSNSLDLWQTHVLKPTQFIMESGLNKNLTTKIEETIWEQLILGHPSNTLVKTFLLDLEQQEYIAKNSASAIKEINTDKVQDLSMSMDPFIRFALGPFNHTAQLI